VKVPTEHALALQGLAELPEDLFERLLSAIETSRRAIEPDQLATELTEKIPEISAGELKSVVAMLVSMYSALDYLDTSPEEFARSIGEAVSQNKLSGIDISATLASVLQSRLSQLLSTDAVSFRSKAVSVLREQNHAFCNSRILTDIRPVFEVDLETAPSSAFIIHTLRISFHRAGSIDEFFVALDKDDLANLQEVVERAQKKDDNLRKVLQHINISALTS
jgi:hypothetical protein